MTFWYIFIPLWVCSYIILLLCAAKFKWIGKDDDTGLFIAFTLFITGLFSFVTAVWPLAILAVVAAVGVLVVSVAFLELHKRDN